jgi:hypothetical protein
LPARPSQVCDVGTRCIHLEGPREPPREPKWHHQCSSCGKASSGVAFVGPRAAAKPDGSPRRSWGASRHQLTWVISRYRKLAECFSKLPRPISMKGSAVQYLADSRHEITGWPVAIRGLVPVSTVRQSIGSAHPPPYAKGVFQRTSASAGRASETPTVPTVLVVRRDSVISYMTTRTCRLPMTMDHSRGDAVNDMLTTLWLVVLPSG